MEKRKTDVLVIGGGAAGLRAALAAKEAGSDVIIVNKGPFARSGITLTAAGGFQAPLHPDDSPELFFTDVVRCGYRLADENLVEVLSSGATAEINELIKLGVNFTTRTDGSLAVGKFPGQSLPRNIFIKGAGVGLVAALVNSARTRNIILFDDFYVTGLLTARDGEIAGAVGLSMKTGEIWTISASSVILATGGNGWLWQVTDCPQDASGEGICLALRAGAELVDMEMSLFYPSVIVWPPSLQGAFVHYEFLSQDMLDGNIYDGSGRSVLPKPLPVRDEAMRLMANEIKNGHPGPHGGLFWYVGDSPKGIDAVNKQLSTAQYNYLRAHGIDPSTARIEVAPGAHYQLGGIHIDENCGTKVPGLFAAPECAGNFDGANRLAGSGLAATQVFGHRAGCSAHHWSSSHRVVSCTDSVLRAEVDRIEEKYSHGPKVDIPGLRQTLRSGVQAYAGVFRNAQGLQALSHLAEDILLQARTARVCKHQPFPQDLGDIMQLESLCENAMLVAGCALQREESRGHHFRTDFPAESVDQIFHTSVRQNTDGLNFSTRPVVRIP